jgi:hypothetical protein
MSLEWIITAYFVICFIVSSLLAKEINTENSSRKLDLGLCPSKNYSSLVTYRDILLSVLNCSSCDFGFTIEEIVSLLKNKTNVMS